MPKGKKKGKFEHRRTEQPCSSDEDAGIDMTIDNCSETSAQSDLKSNHEEAALKKRESPATVRKEDWLRHLSCFRNVSIRPKCGTDINVSATSVTFTEVHTRVKHWECEEFDDESENYDCFDVENELVRDTYLTYGSVYPDLEDEWDTDTDPDSTLEDDHVEVSHQGRPSTFLDTNLREILVPNASPQNKNEVQEKLEDKVLELIEALGARAAAARAAALVALRGALQRRHLEPVLAGRRATLADHVARALRRGRDPERRAAAALAPILALQIGDEGTEEFMKEVRPALVAVCTDKSASLDTRTECCSSLAVLCYLLEEDISEILEILRMYETIFSGSYLKGDGSVKVSAAVVAEGGWHAAALDGWALLLAALEPRHARALLHDRAPGAARLAGLLDAASLEVRMAAGGALAIAHERVTETEEEPAAGAGWPDAGGDLLQRLEQLARDPHKYRAKRDRKLQRATFRDILKYFEEGEVPSLRVRVGAEAVECASWAARGAYGALAAALGAGLRPLLAHCGELRAALGLPAAQPLAAPGCKLNKLQRHLQNSAANKARTVARNKNRDKRSAALAI